MKRYLILSTVLILTLSACSPAGEAAGPMMMGGENNITMRLHHAEIPEPYTGLVSPVTADAESIARGQEVFRIYCAECHGDGGMGDGQTGELLNPSPAVLSHTAQMTSDAYLFWRISEGGAEFGTGMLSFKEKLEEKEIWDAINYIRALGSGDAMPAENGMGGAAYDPEYERIHHEEMLAAAMDEDLIDQAQADNFMLVHETMGDYIVENDLRAGAQSVDEMQPEIFAALVEAGTLTQDQVDGFNTVHQLLLDEGLMQ
ncbi:MAG: cytochrome c [Anaerolineae bacterium]|nr:cytochrome c [Anaerolineae bacterium]MBT7069718.1 cytochrome c [Anaerolineae bacterium]MBT7326732.1 cytochrome c [Anaerolineae bacterium]